MRTFKFRLWSTRDAAWLAHVDSQDEALFLFNNARNQFDVIDYKANDGQGWRRVNADELNRVSIESIYEVDERHDGCRNLIYVTVGIALAATAVMLYFW